MTNDNDFPTLIDPKGFAKGYAYKLNEYEQAGDIPAMKIQDEAFKAYGQPLQKGMSVSDQPTFEMLIGGSPSFDLRFPRMPDNQDVKGIPNASNPELLRKYVERKLKNPDGGQELPGFLKKASAEDAFGLTAVNQGPSTPVKYDENMGGFVPNQGAGRPANVRYKGFPIGA